MTHTSRLERVLRYLLAIYTCFQYFIFSASPTDCLSEGEKEAVCPKIYILEGKLSTEVQCIGSSQLTFTFTTDSWTAMDIKIRSPLASAPLFDLAVNQISPFPDPCTTVRLDLRRNRFIMVSSISAILPES